MFAVIHCKNCDKDSNLSVGVTFTPKFDFCGECGSSRSHKWSFHFCDLKCLFEWLKKNKVEKLGFPCQDCTRMGERPTGFAAGFKENGVCKTCMGKKRVKVSKVILPKGKILGK